MELLFRGEMDIKPNKCAKSVAEGEMCSEGKKLKLGQGSVDNCLKWCYRHVI